MWPFLAKCAPGMLVSRKVVSFPARCSLWCQTTSLDYLVSSHHPVSISHLLPSEPVLTSLLHQDHLDNEFKRPATYWYHLEGQALSEWPKLLFVSFCISKFIFLLVCMCVHMHAGTCRGQKRVAGPRSQSYKRLWATAVGTGNWTGFSARAARALNS